MWVEPLVLQDAFIQVLLCREFIGCDVQCGEVHINELHQGLQVLGRGVARKIAGIVTQLDVDGNLLACQRLVQVRISEVTHTVLHQDKWHESKVFRIFVAIDGCAAFGRGLESDFIRLEVCFLPDDFYAVR